MMVESSLFELWMDGYCQARDVERTTTMVVESTSDDEVCRGGSPSPLSDVSIWLISTLKRRKKMMNKHKLRKRRKKLRLKTRK